MASVNAKIPATLSVRRAGFTGREIRLKCEECGTAFLALRRSAKYHGACRQRAYEKRRRKQ